MNPLVSAIENRLSLSWNEIIFTGYNGGISYTGKEIFQHIKFFHKLFESCNLSPDDKVVLLGRNSCEWGIAFLATITYNTVIVPILPDFSKKDIRNISKHADANFFISTYDFLDCFPDGSNILNLKDFKSTEKSAAFFKELVNKARSIFDEKISRSKIRFTHPKENTLAFLSYTSGTSGFTKGVMLSFKNLYSNVRFALDNFNVDPQQNKILSFLPLSHIYGCLFEFLYPFCCGLSIYFIEKIPAPSVLVDAFQKVKPTIIFMVPLLLEKIYKKKIYPKISTYPLKLFLKIPLINNLVYKKIRKSLTKTFGDVFFEVIIGGAALNPEVETFLRKIKFPITVGYGLTECAPLISFIHYNEFKPFSCGKIVDRMIVKIDSEQPDKIPGEILVKGDNVMLGYYKDKAETKRVLDNEGWLKTGDVGIIDKEKYLYIKGRNKNMILGPSGQNIYPEEIEAKINHLPYIQESVVTDTKTNKLVALVYPDLNYCAANLANQNVEEFLNKLRNEFNNDLPKYMHISKFIVVDKEFVKTPKKSIKRYLYTNFEKQEND